MHMFVVMLICEINMFKPKNNKGVLTKLHRKVKQNENVCRTQNVGHGHNCRPKVCHLQIVYPTITQKQLK